jgi:HSP20 family protein
MAIKDIIPWNREESSGLSKRTETPDMFLSLRDEMDRLFDSFLSSSFDLTPFESKGFSPQMDVSENDKEIKVSVELPGMEEDDVQVSLSRNTLTISGEKKIEKEDKSKNYHRIERSYGTFSRSIPLPEGIDQDKIEAVFKKGVLNVVLPKTAQFVSEHKQIKVKHA